MVQIQAYPLQWPEEFPRTTEKASSAFKTSLTGALNNVKNSLSLFGKDSKKPVKDLVISSNVTLGVPDPPDGGVAVWFLWEGVQICIPVDRYKKVQDNLQAIHHVIEARRTELRHGGLQLIKRTFKGFQMKALPPGKTGCWAILEIEQTDSKAIIEEAYKKLAKRYHPDAEEGSEEKMRQLNDARTQALKLTNK